MPKRLIPWLLASSLVMASGMAIADSLGDRLVVNVNNTSYTQRQVESYVLIRESLRASATDQVQTVDARNWDVALKFFSEEMSVYQEAIRLGSVQLPQEMLRRAIDKATGVLSGDSRLQNLARRLGIDDLTLSRNLNVILRVEAFRRSRTRQEEIAGKQLKEERPRWMTELYERTIIRFYDGALLFREIQPTQGKPIDAL